MATAQISHDGKERNVFAILFRQTTDRLDGCPVHGRVDRNDHIGVIRCDALTDTTLTGNAGVEVRQELIHDSVGGMVEEPPLVRVGRQMLIRWNERCVGENTVECPQIDQIVRAARVVQLELIHSTGAGGFTKG